jgi:predicted amidohydrolase
MLIKIVAVQATLGEKLSLEEKMHILRQRPDFVCLPEYFLVDRATTDFRRAGVSFQENVAYLTKLSEELSVCLIAGTVVEPSDDRLFNTCFVINNGKVIGSYRKRRPVPGELANGISAGHSGMILDVDDTRIALLICGDVFSPELYAELAAEDVDIVFVPTTSPYRPDDSLSQKRLRDKQYFVDGARNSLSYVVKTCGVGTIFGRPLQGRSLIAAPWGVLNQVTQIEEQHKRLLTTTLDIAEIRDFKRKFRRSQNQSGPDGRIHFSSISNASDPERFNCPLTV